MERVYYGCMGTLSSSLSSARIKTGWSTVAARKKSHPSQMKLSAQEIKHIQDVVAQAETLQMAEELRIG